jgi:hypothetical protein
MAIRRGTPSSVDCCCQEPDSKMGDMAGWSLGGPTKRNGAHGYDLASLSRFWTVQPLLFSVPGTKVFAHEML